MHHDPSAIAADINARSRWSDLSGLLTDVRRAYERYVFFPTEVQAIGMALWTAGTHASEAADVTGYTYVNSPERESGKTRALEVGRRLVARPIVAGAGLTDSALVRLVDGTHCTLLVDEVDTIFSPKSDREALRGVLDAGFERDMPAWKNVADGKKWDPAPFYPFGPKMLVGIGGRLPDTIASRCIPIELQRKRRGDATISKFLLHRDPAFLKPIHDALASWATDEVIDWLRRIEPEPAPGLSDRQDDIWRPLLQIADLAGGDWPALARAAASELHSTAQINESWGILVLADTRDVLRSDERISMFELARRLVADGERGPWASWWGREVDSDSDSAHKKVGHDLSRLLKPYGIKAKQVRIDDKNVRGFAAEDFADAFERYLPPLPEAENATTLHRRSEVLSGPGAIGSDTPSEQGRSVVAFQGSENSHHSDEQALELLKTELGAEELPPDAATYAAKLRARGEHPSTIAVMLPTAGYPPPPGFGAWTEYAVRAVLGEAWGQA